MVTKEKKDSRIHLNNHKADKETPTKGSKISSFPKLETSNCLWTDLFLKCLVLS